MDNKSNDNENLVARIRQLEHERDELHKDIEQLCMQQAGPSYLAVASKVHSQRIASLEEEAENLKKKLVACTRENSNLQEELSEVYRIKSQLADLHRVEVTKNVEAEKQLKFFQGSVASAFAERDHSIMEAEKAKEKEELMSQELKDSQRRLEELNNNFLEVKKLNDALHNDLAKHEELNENFKKVVDKFYEIRQQSVDLESDMSWNDKCECLLDDPFEMWSFNDTSTSKYINALEEELKTVRRSMDSLQNKILMGLEIENHLRRRVRELEKKRISVEEMVRNAIINLHHFHSEYKAHVVNLLEKEKIHIKSVIDMIEEKFHEFDVVRAQKLTPHQREKSLDDKECRDVHITDDANLNLVSKRNNYGLSKLVADGKIDATDALAQALQEKVEVLLLLSQQEERHLLERNVNAALQKRVEELQRNLQQVTNEKVRTLMELAQLRQEYGLLQQKLLGDNDVGTCLDITEKTRSIHDGDGKLKHLLRKTYLRRWIGTVDYDANEGYSHQYTEGKTSKGSNSSLDIARMKIENATLKESRESMEHLTSSVHRLRLSLLEAKKSVASEGLLSKIVESIDDVMSEAKLVMTALCSSLPVSWSAEADSGLFKGTIDVCAESSDEKVDYVTAAGFEMVELLMLASQLLKDSLGKIDLEMEA